MLGLDTLDVAIGLVFVYLMVSFVCSAAVELVEVILKNRPKKLFEGSPGRDSSGRGSGSHSDRPLANARHPG